MKKIPFWKHFQFLKKKTFDIYQSTQLAIMSLDNYIFLISLLDIFFYWKFNMFSTDIGSICRIIHVIFWFTNFLYNVLWLITYQLITIYNLDDVVFQCIFRDFAKIKLDIKSNRFSLSFETLEAGYGCARSVSMAAPIRRKKKI